MYVFKYNMLTVYNVINMYVFRLEYLLLDNQLVCSSLEKTVSLPRSIPSLPIILCVRLRFLAFPCSEVLVLHFLTLFVCLLMSSLFISCLDSHVGDTPLGVASNIPKRDNVTTNSQFLWLLQFSHPLFCNVPSALDVRVSL